MLVVATPVRGADPNSASVSLGWSNFRANIGVHTLLAVTFEQVRSRNRLAGMALAIPNMRAVLWIDDDQWADDPMIIQRMLDRRADLIGAPYMKKTYPLEPAHRLAADGSVKWLGFGFTITSRHCLEKMTAASRIYTDRSKEHAADGSVHEVTRRVGNIFQQRYDEVTSGAPSVEDEYMQEDASFCARWRELGGECVLYDGPGRVSHAGSHTFVAPA